MMNFALAMIDFVLEMIKLNTTVHCVSTADAATACRRHCDCNADAATSCGQFPSPFSLLQHCVTVLLCDPWKYMNEIYE